MSDRKASRRRWYFSREEHGEGETHGWGRRWITLDPGPPGLPPTPACMLWTLIRLGWIDKESELGLTGFLWLRLEGRHCLFGSGC